MHQSKFYTSKRKTKPKFRKIRFTNPQRIAHVYHVIRCIFPTFDARMLRSRNSVSPRVGLFFKNTKPPSTPSLHNTTHPFFNPHTLATYGNKLLESITILLNYIVIVSIYYVDIVFSVFFLGILHHQLCFLFVHVHVRSYRYEILNLDCDTIHPNLILQHF